MQTLEKTSQLPDIRLTVRRRMVGYRQRLAERIIEARESKGWDQRELAFRADISEKTLGRIEQGRTAEPRPSTLRKIAAATEREVSEIRPDMETEEKNLRAQLDRIESLLRLLVEDAGLSEPGEAAGLDDFDAELDRQESEPDEEDEDEPGTG